MALINPDTPAPNGDRATIHFDGSCPTNPGPMGIGFSIQVASRHGESGYQVDYGYRVGPGTNNQAEYLALIAALREAARLCITHVQCFSDSLLVVQQVGGRWECRQGTLKRLLEEAKGLAALFPSFSLKHVPRESNTAADHLSKNPTEPTLPPVVMEINLAHRKGSHLLRRVNRKLSRRQAAMIQYWWETRRCQNEYRLGRIFNMTPSMLGRVGKGEYYMDIRESDLPR